MKINRANRDVFGVGTMVFALMAMLFSFGALVVAGQARSDSNDAKSAVAKVAAGGVLASSTAVTLEEFSMTPSPAVLKAGAVRVVAHNVGTVTHELVLVRASTPSALPRVTTAGGERAVGDVDEEAISKANTIGETGDVKAGKTVIRTFKLTPGTYVMFCNIDNNNADGTVTNHFQHGMTATLTVQ
jgi:uncharacterized cupredoxin-like copper-binding protein